MTLTHVKLTVFSTSCKIYSINQSIIRRTPTNVEDQQYGERERGFWGFGESGGGGAQT